MNLTRQHWTSLALGLMAAAVWSRDLSWSENTADTLPLALGLPVALKLAAPWHALTTPNTSPRLTWSCAVAMLGFALGWIANSITLLALAFTALAACWSHHLFQPHPHRGRILLLVLLSFPWLILDWPSIGWHFRISAASCAEWVFNAIQLPATREGTRFVVMGLPIDVKPSCAGWNLLQLSLMAGVGLGILDLPHSRRFWLLVALLPLFAWLANLLRILCLAIIGLSFDANLASGTLHSLTGFITLALVLLLIRSCCLWLAPSQTPTR